MPDNSETVSEPSKITMPNKPIDTEQLTGLLRQSLFADEEKQPAQAETETETESETDGEAEDAQPEMEDDASETESETDSEEADSAEQEKETEDEAEQTSKNLPKGVQKRIDKLIAKRKEAEKQIDELTERLKELESTDKPVEREVIPVGKDLNPYFALQSEREIQDEIKNARQVRRWAEENPDGAIVTGKDGREVEYSAEEVRKIRLNAVDALEEHLPAQLQYVAVRKQYDAEAEKMYPFWKQRQSPEYQFAKQLIEAFPEIQKFPDFKVSIGDMIEGRKMRESNSKKQPQPVKKAPVAPKATSAPASLPSKSVKSKFAEESFRKSPNENNLKALIAERFL
jgi:type I site-specific restriction endonuclease